MKKFIQALKWLSNELLPIIAFFVIIIYAPKLLKINKWRNKMDSFFSSTKSVPVRAELEVNDVLNWRKEYEDLFGKDKNDAIEKCGGLNEKIIKQKSLGRNITTFTLYDFKVLGALGVSL